MPNVSENPVPDAARPLRPSDGGVPTATPRTPAAISEDAREIDPDPMRVIAPAKDYKLAEAPYESRERESLLKAITIDEKGVAHSVHPVSQVDTMLVAVRIDDEDNATRIPMRLDDGHLVVDLPGDQPSRVGFFVGFHGDREISGVIRAGEYPGIPLTTQADIYNAERQGEVMFNVGGIKEDEIDERMWADQIDLYGELGFDPTQTRGVFSKSHRPNPLSDEWQSQRLVVVPDDARDLVDHFDAYDVAKDRLQILGYGKKPYVPFLDFGTTREGYDNLAFGGGFEATREKGLGLGYGSEFKQKAKTTASKVESLQAAFDVRLAPAKSE